MSSKIPPTPVNSSSDCESSGSMEGSIGVILPPVTCTMKCKRRWHNKPIHMSDKKIAIFDEKLSSDDDKIDSAKRFKKYLFEKTGENEVVYQLICLYSGIDYKNDTAIKFESVLKASKVFEEILNEKLIDIPD